jgi:hypothetical protein
MTLTSGAHALELACPECGRHVFFQIEIAGRLTVDELNGGKLRPVLSCKSIEHNCTDKADPDDPSLPFVDAAPDIVDVPLPA